MDILQKALDEFLRRSGTLDRRDDTMLKGAPGKRIKVLAIAPYPAMGDLFAQAALDYPEIDLTVQVGDLKSGLQAALTVFEANYDVVISRGGTARVLEEKITIPVVEVEVSALDVLRQVRHADVGDGRVAAVGFESTLSQLEQGRDVMPPTLDIFTLELADDAPIVMDEVCEGAYSLVLCDNISYLEATRRGLPAQLLESGEGSVRQALETTLFHCRYWSLARDRSRLLWDLARNQSGKLVIYLCGSGLVFSNLGERDVALYDFLERHLNDVRARRLVFRHLGTIYRIKPIRTSISDANVVAFSVTVYDASVQAGLAGIEYLNLGDVADQVDSSFFVKTHALTLLSENIEDALRLGRPVMLCSEVGCGKEQLARIIFLASDYSTRPFVEIDCGLLNKRSERFLTQSYHSPLYEVGQTIYLRGIQNLREGVWREIMAIALESDLSKRCHLIVSGDLNPDGSEPESVYLFAERLKCVIVDIPALRTIPKVIRQDSLNYLEALSVEAGRAMPDVSSEAFALLERSPWPRNNYQLQKVLDRLFVGSAETGTIGAADVEAAIAREEVRNGETKAAGPLDMDVLRPLGEIERDVVREALRRCDGNRTLAAERLHISRTTLWRMLKDG